jgi:acyl-coenzyme A synthetase/AMP-(fatty) acid ligase
VHCTGGYMVYAHTTTKYVFNMQPGDTYWCTADCGWITGHTYLTYGPLLVGASQVVFEGVPTYPGPDRCWRVVDKYAVSVGVVQYAHNARVQRFVCSWQQHRPLGGCGQVHTWSAAHCWLAVRWLLSTSTCVRKHA